MAQLEIRDAERVRILVELSSDPMPLGFDAEGRVAWGRGRVARPLAEVTGDLLREGDSERRLEPGETIRLEGLEIVYHPSGEMGTDVRAAALSEIGNLLWTVERPGDLFGRVLDALSRVLHLRRAALALLDDDEDLKVRAARGEGLSLNQTITRAVMESGAAILTSEAAVHEDTDDEITFDVRSILCAPLRHKGESQGVLYADNEGRSSSFSNEELDFAAALAHLTSFALANLTRTERLQEENILLRQRLSGGGQQELPSQPMREIGKKIEKVAGFDATVLITGESGVGKEMVAREIHRRSPRREGAFVAVNCAAIPETLLESELFGYAPQSAISGADPKGRAGKFEQADNGTIFLDEIAEMKPELQTKLLRVLQDKKVDRLHDTVSRDVDVRIVVATNQQLERRVEEGRFREDLYYRLNVVAIEVPPLRERREDIPVLAEFFVRTYPGPEELRKARISRAVARALEACDWPGNVRELKNCIEQALILGDGKTIRLKDLPPAVRQASKADGRGRAEDLVSLAEVEKNHIAAVLNATGWNKAKSARVLGISKPTLYEKIRVFDLQPEP
ncbi:MAG: sigma 54-interacting transcriptional regulator [Planctomycetota bacterium]|jgi:transcriptional regulator with GAF, ATPase, and Fis domain